MGVELEIRLPRRPALRRADGLLRSVDRLRDHYGAADRRLAQPQRHRALAEGRARHEARPAELVPRLALAVAVPDVRRLLHLVACRDQPPALRSSRGRIGAGRGLHGRIFLHALHDVHAGRVCGHRAPLRADDDPLPRGMAAAGGRRRAQLGSGHHLVRPQGLLRLLHVRAREGVRAALPLRPADASRLEGVPAAVACDGRDRRLRAQADGMGLMSLPAIGALVGLLAAAIEMVVLRALSKRVDLPETKKVLNVVGVSQFVLFPIVGWFAADAIGGQ